MQKLLKLSEELGLRIIEAPGEHQGGLRPGSNTIRISPGLSRRYYRSVLAHEIGHYVLGHMPTVFGPLRRKQERAANEWAANFLISRRAYIDAENIREGHIPSMAFELDVVPELVIAFQYQLQLERARS